VCALLIAGFLKVERLMLLMVMPGIIRPRVPSRSAPGFVTNRYNRIPDIAGNPELWITFAAEVIHIPELSTSAHILSDGCTFPINLWEK
jgi:hypothetical protein